MTTTKTPLYQYLTTSAGASFAFSDGTTLEVLDTALTDDIRTALIWHGLKQKVADGAAMSRNPETGRPASDADKIARMRAIADRLLAGQWRAEGQGGNQGGLLLRALMELYPSKSRDALVEYLDRLTAAQKTALRASSKIAPIIERLKGEPAIDGDELLAELDD